MKRFLRFPTFAGLVWCGALPLLLGFALLTAGTPARSQDVVRIGALYPLSGQAAKSGEDTLNAIRLAVDVINGKYPDSKLPFAKPGGLPGLKGAKIELIAADHQGSPEIGAAEAERMITQQKAVALIGAFYSSVASTVSQVAERNEIPFITGEVGSDALDRTRIQMDFPHHANLAQSVPRFLCLPARPQQQARTEDQDHCHRP